MLEPRRTPLRRVGLRRPTIASALRDAAEHLEPELGNVAAQARHVAAAVTVLVAIGIVAGCVGTPEGVDCGRYTACSAAEPCGACVDVPGCGPLHVDPVDACEQSCPLAFECALTSTCPARVRCDGLVPGRVASLQPEL
jgi:hypothetical protein